MSYTDQYTIAHPEVAVTGRCLPSALPYFEELGWVVVPMPDPEAEAAARPKEELFVEVHGEMVPLEDSSDPAAEQPELWVEAPEEPEWTASGASEVEATGAAVDEESIA